MPLLELWRAFSSGKRIKNGQKRANNQGFPVISRYGFKVAQYPWYFVAGCLILSGLCGIGLINYTEENNAFRLWIPEESEFVKNYEWLQKNYPPDARYSNIIITSIGDKENVLTADVLQMVSILDTGGAIKRYGRFPVKSLPKTPSLFLSIGLPEGLICAGLPEINSP